MARRLRTCSSKVGTAVAKGHAVPDDQSTKHFLNFQKSEQGKKIQNQARTTDNKAITKKTLLKQFPKKFLRESSANTQIKIKWETMISLQEKHFFNSILAKLSLSKDHLRLLELPLKFNPDLNRILTI